MNFTAVWPISDPSDSDAADSLGVGTPEDVDALLARLAEPGAGPATLEHAERDLITDTEGLLGAPGDTRIPDHDVVTAVHGGYGYLTYADPEHDYAVLRGRADSPAHHTEHVDYPAGSGVPVGELAAALKDFLATGERPTAVEWREV
ncbi:Imm1 family immunity protein [Saccharothrix xinjiangensis]|uniref:Imm1 family immunity protein n=1 Tax=Saccharothrix xinjiangensis TaxID=204798 RepID=A0ABV9Y7L3_9PSEU